MPRWSGKGLRRDPVIPAATGAQLWSRTLVGNDHEGIAMAPGYNNGTVYVSTVPANVTIQYWPGGEGILWALNAKTGAPEWSWNQVQNLWGNPAVNSGGGLWYTPSFDAQGNIYIGVANPAPVFGTKDYPPGSSRPRPDLYTDSVVKLGPAGKLLWYYQLTPLPSSPYGAATVTNDVVFTTTSKGYLYALDATTGAILFKTPMSAGSDGQVAVHGDYVIAGAGAALSATQRNLIIAYKLGATGKLPTPWAHNLTRVEVAWHRRASAEAGVGGLILV